jgi:tetratricopeptide (TPR) repeat protein/transcriptional regulator with XRE-family HTH domain
VAEPPAPFAGLLRKLRVEAGLTQEELAEAAGLSPRSISDLERGINLTARKHTARLLADALNLTGSARTEFEATARGRVPAIQSSPSVTAAALTSGIATATRTLPRDIASFTGREPELRELVDAVGYAAGSGGVVAIHAIGGMAGVGKTAFAVHAAHKLSPRFPGGQVFLPLHGHTPGRRPVDPVDALASLLMTDGVPVQQIPSGLEPRMALWRDRVVGRQLLLVLDDAADSDQIRPLLPGTSENLVLVTSRRHLTALEDVQSISLDTLEPDVAAGLLVRLAARADLGPDDVVDEITRLCGYLPLAIGMLARQLHHHPAWTPSDLAADLAAARDRLELMQAENLSVAAAFNLSYEDLTGAQRRLFRRLGLHPGADIDAYAAAALDDIDLATARRHLDGLYDHYLLTEPTRGRYRMHDLIREHAHGLAALDDPEGDREDAMDRLLDYYQYTAEMAGRYVARYTRSNLAAPVTPPDAVPDLPDGPRALSWARSERANLLACLDHATRAGRDTRVAALMSAMAAFLEHDGPWADAIPRHVAAVKAAQRSGDRLSHANALHDLAVVRRLTAAYPDAAQASADALHIFRDLGDRLGEANALNTVGKVRLRTGDFSGAAEALTEALGRYREVGDRLGQANALNELGVTRYVSTDHQGAGEALEEALGISRDIGDRTGESSTLRNLGALRRQTEDYPGAIEAVEEALRISRDIGDRMGESSSLMWLGSVVRLTGDYPAAAQLLDEALRMSRDIGDRQGQVNALSQLGIVRRHAGDYPGAIRALEEAVSISGDIGYRQGQANALKGLGIVFRLTGGYSEAADALRQALGIYRELGNRGGEVEAVNETGSLHRVRGDLDLAVACHREALHLAREIASAWDEAHALAGLARCDLAARRPGEAVTRLGQALEIFQRIGAGEAVEVSAELAALGDGEPGGSNGA